MSQNVDRSKPRAGTAGPPTGAGSALRWAAASIVLILVAAAIGAVALTRRAPSSHSTTQATPLAAAPLAAPAQGPTPRSEAMIAFDESTATVLMFGGTTNHSAGLDDTWTWNQARGWQLEHPIAAPTARFRGVMAYDPLRQELVLYGGVTGAQDFHDTWVWRNQTWTKRESDTPIPRSDIVTAAFEPKSKSVLLFERPLSGGDSQTWSWDGLGWSQLHPSTKPDASGSLVFDGRQLILLGGVGMDQGQYLTHSWAWSGTDWVTMATADRLPLSYYYRATYDAARAAVIAYVNPQGPPQAETWSWNGSTWARLHPVHQPPPTTDATLIYDPKAKLVLLIGGQLRESPAQGIWSWDGTDWSLAGGSSGEAKVPAGTLPAPLATDAAGIRRLVAQIDGLTPRLLPTSMPAGLSGTVSVASGAYQVSYSDESHERSVTFGVLIPNPPAITPAGRISSVSFRGVQASYAIYDLNGPKSQRYLRWTEAGSWTGSASNTIPAGVPYFLTASGLTDEEFFRMANSLIPA